jgi:hypothetical protein
VAPVAEAIAVVLEIIATVIDGTAHPHSLTERIHLHRSMHI